MTFILNVCLRNAKHILYLSCTPESNLIDFSNFSEHIPQVHLRSDYLFNIFGSW